MTALLVVATAGAVPARAQATPIPDGRGVPHPRAVRVLRVPSEWHTIQAAIDHARDGDVVLVAPGTYTGVVDFHGKAIEVIGVEGATRTILYPCATRGLFGHTKDSFTNLASVTL